MELEEPRLHNVIKTNLLENLKAYSGEDYT